MSRMGRSIRDYVSKGGDISYERLKARFGEPNQIAFVYANEMTTGEVLDNIRIGRKVIKIVSAVAIAIGVLWLGYLALCIRDVNNTVNGYLAIGDAVIIDKTEISDGG